MKKVTVIKNDISELDKITQDVEDLGEKWELSPKIVFNLNLVLDEIFTNIVSYAYEDDKTHEVVIRFEMTDKEDKLLVQVEDEGKPFDPLQVSAEDEINKSLEEREIGGLGIHFLKQMMTDLKYERVKNRNILHFASKINH